MDNRFNAFIIKTTDWYLKGSRWWVPLSAGALYSIALPPLNHELHWSLALFPFLSFITIIPLLAISSQQSLKRAAVHSYLFGYTAAFGQYHWLIFDRVEGLWHLVILGLLLTSAVVGILYLLSGMLFRASLRIFPKSYIIVFPSLWVAVDYFRTLGDIAFPWAFLGYAFTPILPLSQTASVTGVWGLTFIIVTGNVLVWQVLRSAYRRHSLKRNIQVLCFFFFLFLVSGLFGWFRIKHYSKLPAGSAAISLLQPNIDQFRWSNDMLDTAFAVCESLMAIASADKPDLFILPESALLCYINHRQSYRTRLMAAVKHFGTPLIFGSLNWEPAKSGSPYEALVYNTAFLADTGAADLQPYHKIKLVPFSEAIPFEGLFPLLSRVNLGEADFSCGSEQTIYRSGGVRAAPFICYEIIFPDFVRKRLRHDANLIINITNDGWFGRSSGPHHHATMARMRSIENGISMARCANSGISMFVTPLGELDGNTGLYRKETLTRKVTLARLPSLYSAFGDWFVVLCIFIILTASVFAVHERIAGRTYR